MTLTPLNPQLVIAFKWVWLEHEQAHVNLLMWVEPWTYFSRFISLYIGLTFSSWKNQKHFVTPRKIFLELHGKWLVLDVAQICIFCFGVVWTFLLLPLKINENHTIVHLSIIQFMSTHTCVWWNHFSKYFWLNWVLIKMDYENYVISGHIKYYVILGTTPIMIFSVTYYLHVHSFIMIH